MKHTVQLLEQLSLNGHPALNTLDYDGWSLRFAEGYTKRANSVNMLDDFTLPIADKIKYCEEKYKEQNLPTVFKITPISAELDELLEAEGYSYVDKTNVMTMDLSKIKPLQKTDHTMVSVTVEDNINEAWQYYYFTFNNVSATVIPAAKKIQEKIVAQTLCATVYDNKKAVACGLCVVEQGYAGLYDIVVKEDCRGQGFGKILCRTLLDKAKESGAVMGYLSVVDSNTAAKGLYKSLGFEEQYSYWYRMKDDLTCVYTCWYRINDDSQVKK